MSCSTRDCYLVFQFSSLGFVALLRRIGNQNYDFLAHSASLQVGLINLCLGHSPVQVDYGSNSAVAQTVAWSEAVKSAPT